MARASRRDRREIAAEAAKAAGRNGSQNRWPVALFSLLGHKGDLMLVHFRESFDQLNQAELDLARLRLNDFLEPTTSYLSVIELGLYESIVEDLQGAGRTAASSRTPTNGRRQSPKPSPGRKKP